MAKFLTQEVKKTLSQAIADAEKATSAEIAVCICKKSKGDTYKAAQDFFDKKELFKTKERNAVLIFLAYNDKKLAILGDKGINEKVPEGFWEETLQIMTANFKKGQFSAGLNEGIQKIGQQLAEFYPWTENDENELDNEIHIQD